MLRLKEIFKQPGSGSITIVMVYFAFGLAWINFSDALVLKMYPDAMPDEMTTIQNVKGWAYVTITSLLLFVLISIFAHRLKTVSKQQLESGNVLKKLVEEVGVGIARLNQEGKFIYANPDLCEMLGYTEDELLHKSLLDIIHPTDRAKAQACWENITKREIDTCSMEMRLLNKYNQILWINEKLTIVEDDRRDAKYFVLVIHNINAQKLAEQQLEEHLKYYQTILEHSFDGVSIVDKEGAVKYQTPSVEKIIGHAKDSRIGASVFSFVSTEDIPKVQSILQQMQQNAVKEARTVIGYIRGDEQKRYLDLHIKNMLNEPPIFGLVVNFRDITDKYIMEHRLEENMEQYKLLFMHNPVPMFIYDLVTLRYLQVNDAAVKNYGYTREEFLSLTLKDIRPAEDIAKVLEDIAKVDTGEQDKAQIWRHLTKSGELKYVEIAAINTQYNGQRARMSIANDVTDMVQRQEAIRQSEQRYRHLVEHLPAGAVLVQGSTIYFNKAITDITGYTNQEIGTLNEWFEVLYGKDAEIIRGFYEDDKASNFGSPRTVFLTSKDQRKKWITFYAYRYETGEVWLVQDVTEQKRMDELIVKSNMEAADRERKELSDKLNTGITLSLEKAIACITELNNTPEDFDNQRDKLLICLEEMHKAHNETKALSINLIATDKPLS